MFEFTLFVIFFVFVYQRDQFTRAHTKEGRKNKEIEKDDDRYRFKTNQPTNSETWPYNIEKKKKQMKISNYLCFLLFFSLVIVERRMKHASRQVRQPQRLVAVVLFGLSLSSPLSLPPLHWLDIGVQIHTHT